MFYQTQHFGISEYFCKESGENFNFPTHIHRSFELITILDGEMTVNIGSLTYILRRGEGVLIFPEQTHSLECSESKHLLVIFSPDIVRAYYSKHSAEYPENNKISVPEHLISQISELEKDSSVIKMKAALYSLCSILDENTEYEKRKNSGDGLLYAIFDFVEKNFEGECTLEGLGSSLGYNSSYLSRYFSEATNMTFISFVNRYRISKACYILTNSYISVLECSYECGYTSLRSFNRNFKMYVGMSPKNYRAGGS